MHEDILWLQITVLDFVRMKELKSIENLSEELHRFEAIQSFRLLSANVLEKVALITVLHYNKDIQRNLEEFVNLNNVAIVIVTRHL